MEYIDKSAVVEMLDKLAWDKEGDAGGFFYPVMARASLEVEYFPAADVAPVVHEHWIKCQFADSAMLLNKDKLCLTDGFICGNCGHDAYEKTAYCPHCGAKMDVETP